MKPIEQILQIDLEKLSAFEEFKQVVTDMREAYQQAGDKEKFIAISKKSIEDILSMTSQLAPDALPTTKAKDQESKPAPVSSQKKERPKQSDSISAKEKKLMEELEQCQKECAEETSETKKAKKTEKSSGVRSKSSKASPAKKTAPADSEKGVKTTESTSMDDELLKDKVEQQLLGIVKLAGKKRLTDLAKTQQIKSLSLDYYNELIPTLGLKNLKRDQTNFEKQIDELIEKHGVAKVKELAKKWKEELPSLDKIEKNEKKFYAQKVEAESENILSILKQANSLLAQNKHKAAEYLAERLSADQLDIYLPAYIKELF